MLGQMTDPYRRSGRPEWAVCACGKSMRQDALMCRRCHREWSEVDDSELEAPR